MEKQLKNIKDSMDNWNILNEQYEIKTCTCTFMCDIYTCANLVFFVAHFNPTNSDEDLTPLG